METTKTSIWLPAWMTRSYWKNAIHPTAKIKLMCFMALMMALNIVVSSFFIPLGDSSLRVYFSFLPTSIASMTGGPVFALCYGFVVDILGFIIHPTGVFFPGYTLSSMLGALIYAIFLFHQQITVVKLFLAKLCVNVFVNIMLGCLWNEIQFGKGYLYYLFKSVPKNLLLLPLEVFMLYLMLKAFLPIMKKMGFMNQTSVKIPFWREKKTVRKGQS